MTGPERRHGPSTIPSAAERCPRRRPPAEPPGVHADGEPRPRAGRHRHGSSCCHLRHRPGGHRGGRRRARLAARGPRAAPAEHDHRRRPADLRQQPARAAGPARPRRRAQGTRRHPRRPVRAAGGLLRRPAAVRRQRLARAAHAPDQGARPCSRSPSPTRPPPPSTWQAVSRELLASNAEQERLIEALLTLASSEAADSEREPLDLAAIASAALAAARPAIRQPWPARSRPPSSPPPSTATRFLSSNWPPT